MLGNQYPPNSIDLSDLLYLKSMEIKLKVRNIIPAKAGIQKRNIHTNPVR